MGDGTVLDFFIQGGGFALAAYLVVWLTRRLNGKLDRLADATDRNTATTRELTGAVKELRDHLERSR